MLWGPGRWSPGSDWGSQAPCLPHPWQPLHTLSMLHSLVYSKSSGQQPGAVSRRWGLSIQCAPFRGQQAARAKGRKGVAGWPFRAGRRPMFLIYLHTSFQLVLSCGKATSRAKDSRTLSLYIPSRINFQQRPEFGVDQGLFSSKSPSAMSGNNKVSVALQAANMVKLAHMAREGSLFMEGPTALLDISYFNQ